MERSGARPVRRRHDDAQDHKSAVSFAGAGGAAEEPGRAPPRLTRRVSALSAVAASAETEPTFQPPRTLIARCEMQAK